MESPGKMILALLFLCSAATSALFAQAKAPAVYVDKGACPFECCTYRTWRTEKNTVGYASPHKSSKRVGIFKAGTRVVGLTGEVRTKPGTFKITKAHEKYRPGDTLLVYTPLGEGFYKVWFKGRMFQEELDFMSGPFEQSLSRCNETPACWGTLEKQMEVDWWVKVRSRDGWVGWTNQTGNFSNIDACG